MSKKKKNLSKELLDLKINEASEVSLHSEALDLDLDEMDIPEFDESVDFSQTSAEPANRDNTIRLVSTSAGGASAKKKAASEQAADDGEEVRVSYGLPAKQQVPKMPDNPHFGSDSQLKQSEHLRIAQKKINDLEEEVVKLRRENEDLASAAETFKKLNDEYYSEIDSFKAKVGDQKQTFAQEVQLLKRINQSKDKQIVELKQQVEDYKSRVDNNYQRVRKREKDLEHRLEIAKIEEQAVLKSKDQLILDLKRRIDELSNESDNFRRKSQENYKELQKKQQVVRAATRALRIALTKLEGDDDSDFGLDSSQPGEKDDQ